MNKLEFKALIKAHTNKTAKIRVVDPWRSSAVESIPDPIPGHIGSIIKTIDAQIDKFCGKDEGLLINDFQLMEDSERSYCSLNAVIKPLAELEKTHKNEGKPIQVVVEGSTGELMNASECLVRMGIDSEEDMLSRETYGYAYRPQPQKKHSIDLEKIKKLQQKFALGQQQNRELYEIANMANKFIRFSCRAEFPNPLLKSANSSLRVAGPDMKLIP